MENQKVSSKKPMYKKWWFWVLAPVLFFIIIGIASGDSSSGISTDIKQESVAPHPDSVEKQDIHQSIANLLKGTMNMDNTKPRLKELKITDTSSGYDIWIEFNANDNMTTDLRNRSVITDMGKIYQLLFGEGDKNISKIRLVAFFGQIDKYGNSKDTVVHETTMTKSIAQKIDWNYVDVLLRQDILPQNWNTVYIHPQFKYTP